jgi:histidine triad (HIT) family protein
MSLYATYEQSNIFQRILSGAMPCAKVFEDDHTLSFMDVFPQAKGHTLVIPKTAACNLFDISEDALKVLIARTQIIGRAVRDALDPDGIQIMQFNGDAAGQTVFHIHFHIIPRWHDMTLKSHAKGVMADLSDLRDTAARITAKIKV